MSRAFPLMDMTNFAFSEDDDSFQSQTLKANIQQISRQLILNSTPSPTHIAVRAVPNSSSSSMAPNQEEAPRQGDPADDQQIPSLPWNTSLVLVPNPYAPQTSRTIMAASNLPVVRPASVLVPSCSFRDFGTNENNNVVDTQTEPFDLTTDSALDLRIQPSHSHITEIEWHGKEQDQPLALVKPKEEGSLSDISTQTDPLHASTTTTTGKLTTTTTSTCTSLDETMLFPIPHPDQDDYKIIKELAAEEAIITTSDSQTSAHNTLHRGTDTCSRNDTDSADKSDSLKLKRITGLDTIKQSYAPSADDTCCDRTSTTVLIDDAFRYLTDIPDESSQVSSHTTLENRPAQGQITETNAKSPSNLNETYDVVSKPIVLIKKPPTGLKHKQKSNSKIVHRNDSTLSTTQEHTINPTTEESNSSLPNSSFTTITSLDSDATKSTWSVKETVTTLKSGLTLTLTKTASTSTSMSSFSVVDSPKASNDKAKKKEDNLSSTPKSRVVIGSNGSIEESTIVKEASDVASNTQSIMFVSYPTTPDVSLCQSSHNTRHQGCNTNAVTEKVMSSARGEIRKEPIGGCDDNATQPEPKEESLRKRLMKKSVPITQSTDTDSVLNIAFTRDAKQAPPVKRKKKSLLKVLKKQLMCSNASNVSQISQQNRTITATCLGRIIRPQQRKKSSCRRPPNFFAKCNELVNHSSATVSICTLDRSHYSSPLPAWCRQIIATTETTSTPKPIPTPAEVSTTPTTNENKSTKSSHSKSVGISTSSSTPKQQSNKDDDDSQMQNCQQRPNPFFDSVGISWLSQIDPCHTPDRNTTSKSVSTTIHESRREQLSSGIRSTSNIPTPELTTGLCHRGSSTSAPINSDMPVLKVMSPPVQPTKSRPKASKTSSSGSLTSGQKGSSPPTTLQDKSGPKASSPSDPRCSLYPAYHEGIPCSSPPLPRLVSPHSKIPVPRDSILDMSRSSPLTFDTQQVKHVRNWMALSSSHSQIEMIENVGRLTAEWLTTFMMDKSMHRFQSYFDIQPNRNVLLELCQMCSIRVRASSVDPDLLVLTKTSTSRAPNDADVKKLIRGTRR